MKAFLAIICPPGAVLLTGRPISAVLNIALTLCLWLPGVVHALFVLSQDQRARHHHQTLQALRGHAARPTPRPLAELTVVMLIIAAAAIIAAVAALRHDLTTP